MTLTYRKAFENLRDKLSGIGVENAAFEARQILYHASGLSPLAVLGKYNEDVGTKVMAQIMMDYAERMEGRPLQYIVGKWGFYNVEVFVKEGILIPRQDTEALVDCGLEFLEMYGDTEVLDLCSGSGCIALSIKKARDNCSVSALEKYKTPLEFIKKNAEHNALDITILEGDVLNESGISGEYGLILSNPPYIRTKDCSTLQKEVQKEPIEALDGGEDGLKFYRAIAKWQKALKKGGMLAVEIGMGQEKEVADIFSSAGLEDINTHLDANGIIRVVSGIRK